MRGFCGGDAECGTPSPPDEGEGQSSVAQWREEHEALGTSISSDLGGITIDDDTKVMLEHFTVER
ncbi:hypothetical protein PG2105B_0986 [Bifidobacterium pseudolongum subsp. globosum]|jgi:uncharacterized protein YhfF|uniref:Uncharacterized protein n=1 Tax=Bifidobacterium pseudolongum TaxID=1694 RepID=A0A248X710_9BIFI|nr:hypothetical protein [Bifidobacterium pseudolongum]RYQ07285.1 hypothetical protein PG2105B_0986 [Bifidobacterium pseudolongum subsp. globosum]ASW24306.1 hypothetical protein BPSOL_1104 [Bifidobacterium pseudolongum]RYQ42319.1 hypothetical protein PG1805B_1152 [Bifidobacterium pseudolongum subsp. globosum]RYQ67889.1 hypothetical protein PG2103B_1082 [Bifidobacterium pseudolongum subsp. globosum]THG27965.1 hypothetical protein E5991_00500 [Bifidobacterium pseudolongum]